MGADELRESKFSESKIALRKLCAQVGVRTASELLRVYTQEDQRLFALGLWDYDNPSLLVNKIYTSISRIDISTLRVGERVWCNEILWFWYHHAISCAISKKRDKEKARLFSEIALGMQPPDHPNQITRLLYLLTHDRFAEAESWASLISDRVERRTAREIIAEYGSMFDR